MRTPHQRLADMLRGLDDDTLRAFVRYEQGRANWLQSEAARAQREADMARKTLRRRKRGTA